MTMNHMLKTILFIEKGFGAEWAVESDFFGFFYEIHLYIPLPETWKTWF